MSRSAVVSLRCFEFIEKAKKKCERVIGGVVRWGAKVVADIRTSDVELALK